MKVIKAIDAYGVKVLKGLVFSVLIAATLGMAGYIGYIW